MQALSSASDDPEQAGPPPAMSAPPAAANRIEDDRTAGTRGTTPQSPTTSYDPVAESRAYDPTTGRRALARLPLETQIGKEQSELDRMNQPTKLSLKQRVLGGLQGAAFGASDGTADEMATLRDRVAGRKQQERESLGSRISTDTRALTEQDIQSQRIDEQERAANLRNQTMADALGGRMQLGREQIAGRQSVADTRAGSAEDIAQANRDARPIVKVMGDRSFQYDPDAGNWFDIGAAPVNQTRPPTEQGQYTPVPDPADPNRIIGWVNPKARQYTPATAIPGLGAAPGGTGPGAGTGSIPSKVTGQSKSRADAGRAIIPLIDSVDQMLNDPEVLQGMGPLPGRVSDAERYIGNAPPKIARLYGTLKSIYSLGGTLHGWRALQVAQEFEKAYGGLKTNPDALRAALESMRDTAQSVMGAGGYNTPATPSAAPSAAPSRPPKAGMKWQRNKHTGELREVPRG